MKEKILFIHFGELSTKGNNRHSFVDRLYTNIRHAMAPFGVETKKEHDHVEVFLFDKDEKPVVERLREVAGIQRISLSLKVDKDVDAIKATALELLEKEQGRTFKINVKRIDKTFPVRSYDLTCDIAGYILDHSSYKVDLHTYDVLLKVLIKDNGAYLFCQEWKGAGGYPLGMNGKALALLSGGLDSPVACYSLLRRGIAIDCLHFASPPYTSEAVIDKLTDILKQLNLYQRKITLIVVPFTKLQEAIYANVAEPYCITIMRRMMLRIATKVASMRGCLALSTGESIGQVASQTLESISVINEVTSTPVIRPLATSDKVDIIDTAKRIGTYDISIRPYEDCCTIFKPKKPKTKPKLEECLFYEGKWDYQSQIEEAVSNLKFIEVREGEIFINE